MIKTMVLSEKLWRKITRDKLTLGCSKMEDVIWKYIEIVKEIKKGSTDNDRSNNS